MSENTEVDTTFPEELRICIAIAVAMVLTPNHEVRSPEDVVVMLKDMPLGQLLAFVDALGIASEREVIRDWSENHIHDHDQGIASCTQEEHVESYRNDWVHIASLVCSDEYPDYHTAREAYTQEQRAATSETLHEVIRSMNPIRKSRPR